MDYNVRMIDYKHGLQMRIYSEPINYTSIYKPKPITKKDILNSINLCDEDEDFSVRMENQKSTENSLSRTKQQIYRIARSNEWEYFVTLTFNPKIVDSTSYEIVRKKLKYWLNNLKKRYSKDLKYFFVPEYHKDKEKLHFHGLMSYMGDIPLQDSGRVSIGRYAYRKEDRPVGGHTIYNLPKWNYGFSTATKVVDSKRASSYITKYITKDLCMLSSGLHRYLASANLEEAKDSYAKVDYQELKRLVVKYQKDVDYVKNLKCPYSGKQVTYLEFSKGDSK